MFIILSKVTTWRAFQKRRAPPKKMPAVLDVIASLCVPFNILLLRKKERGH
jgi:hypothetical protein